VGRKISPFGRNDKGERVLNEWQQGHVPVLWEPLLGLLEYGPDAVVVDATIGLAGHASLLAGRLGEKGLLIGLDVDPASLAVSGERLSGASCRVELIRENFGGLTEVLSQLNIEKVDVIVADLGVNSSQLADSQRGMSFQLDGPLDMRLDDRCEETAGDLVNGLDEQELADVIYRYGEERKSRRIARAIVAARKERPIERTGELVEIVGRTLNYTGGGRKSKIHPATRTFQALRIAVNDELGQLERLLEQAPLLLNEGGQVAIISFHSLEDRLVKYSFRDNKQAGIFEILTKKPIIAAEEERMSNPRSRSGKLRAARRVMLNVGC
jgi:16S rRNA (cytosine1402-N4)-methyltransferase